MLYLDAGFARKGAADDRVKPDCSESELTTLVLGQADSPNNCCIHD